MPGQRKRNPNGAGTITRRKDGRFQCAVYVLQPDGTRARKFAYGKTWAECDAKRRELLDKVEAGVPVPTRSAKLAEWLPYWLDHFIKPNRKRTTYNKYAMHVRLYLVPLLGTKSLEALGPRHVRTFVAEVSRLASPATAKEAHRVLRTALAAACREELVTRNAASLVEAPKVPRRDLSPWDLDETLAFLEQARSDPLYAAFVLAVSMGLRRGEILGLRWSDVDLEHRVLRVSKQVQRVGGELYEDTTKSGRARPLPLPLICLAALRWHRMRQSDAARRKGVELSPSSYVFTTRTGRPIDPQNVNRSFFRITAA
ncbi:site-specific integrase, partial [Streptomyces chiangmaiensis]